jgi:hypothetical protein
MQTVENQIFATDIVVLMDDKQFQSCKFDRCTLVYGGGDYYWIDCEFTECKVRLIGAAERSSRFLSSFGFVKSDARLTSTPPDRPIQ